MEKIKKIWRAIQVMWLRQIKRHFRSRSRIFASLGQPLMFLLAFGFGFGPIFSRAGGGDYIQFLAPGIITISIMFSAMFSGIEVISDKQFGFLKETLVAPIPRWAIMIGRSLGGATASIFQGFAVFFIALLVGFRPDSWAGLPMAIVFMFLVALLFTLLGTTFATLFDDMHALPLIMNFFIIPLFFLSGALFPLPDLPSAMALIVKFNPLSYGVDGLRSALSSQSHLGLRADLSVLIIFIIIFLALGAYRFRRIEA